MRAYIKIRLICQRRATRTSMKQYLLRSWKVFAKWIMTGKFHRPLGASEYWSKGYVSYLTKSFSPSRYLLQQKISSNNTSVILILNITLEKEQAIYKSLQVLLIPSNSIRFYNNHTMVHLKHINRHGYRLSCAIIFRFF